MISSPPPKRSARHSKARPNARRIRIPNGRWPGCPGSLLVSADGIATTSRPVQRPCEPAGLSSPTGLKAIVLQWLCKMCESRSSRGRDGESYSLILISEKQKYFRDEGWTRQNQAASGGEVICRSGRRIELFSSVIPGRAEREPGISRFPDAQLRV